MKLDTIVKQWKTIKLGVPILVLIAAGLIFVYYQISCERKQIEAMTVLGDTYPIGNNKSEKAMAERARRVVEIARDSEKTRQEVHGKQVDKAVESLRKAQSKINDSIVALKDAIPELRA